MRVLAWVLVAGNAVYLTAQTQPRLADTVRESFPPAGEWGDYELLDRQADP